MADKDYHRQVAAVCYRQREGEIEFLLVRTKRGLWTYPKGHTEPHLTDSQAAWQEAEEEAGVVAGNIDTEPFATYIYLKKLYGGDGVECLISAYLLEVTETGPCPESHRDPTWFAPEPAKVGLAEGRQGKYQAEITKIIGIAIENIS